MKRFECPREQDVLDAVTSRRWPARIDAELREHVGSCALCADLVAVAVALLDAEGDAPASGDLPPASLVWWRAQLRAREEASRAALRPIKLIQGVAGACAVALLLMALAFVAPRAWAPIGAAFAASGQAVSTTVHAAFDGARAAMPVFDPDVAGQAALAVFASRSVQLAAAAWLVLAPVAIYLAFARD